MIVDRAPKAETRARRAALGLDPEEPVGTPEEIAASPQSYTGQYLKQVLKRRSARAKDAMVQMRKGDLKIAHTKHPVERFREIEQELEALRTIENFAEFVPAWLPEEFDEEDPFAN